MDQLLDGKLFKNIKKVYMFEFPYIFYFDTFHVPYELLWVRHCLIDHSHWGNGLSQEHQPSTASDVQVLDAPSVLHYCSHYSVMNPYRRVPMRFSFECCLKWNCSIVWMSSLNYDWPFQNSLFSWEVGWNYLRGVFWKDFGFVLSSWWTRCWSHLWMYVKRQLSRPEYYPNVY